MTKKELEKTQQTEVTRRDKETQARSDRVYMPAADIWETKDTIEMTLDMPGVEKDGLEITVERNTLIIHGRVREPQQGTRVYTEHVPGDYHREFALSDDLDMEKIDAELTSGVLHLSVHKTEKVKPRKIAITAG